jgi:hypothetical protein
MKEKDKEKVKDMVKRIKEENGTKGEMSVRVYRPQIQDVQQILSSSDNLKSDESQLSVSVEFVNVGQDYSQFCHNAVLAFM